MSSLKKLGMKTEKAPAERPKINLPTRIATLFANSVMPQPMKRTILLAKMHLLFPYFINGPEKIAPIADPKVQIALISPFQN
jgi:hypothetical protein